MAAQMLRQTILRKTTVQRKADVQGIQSPTEMLNTPLEPNHSLNKDSS